VTLKDIDNNALFVQQEGVGWAYKRCPPKSGGQAVLPTFSIVHLFGGQKSLVYVEFGKLSHLI